jgi:D-alanine-D-alanine ligase
VRGIASDMGIPVPFGYVIQPEEDAYRLPTSFPVIVKPTMGDSSFGIWARNVVHDAAALTEVIADLHRAYNRPVLVEEFLTGADLTIGILGNPPNDYTVLPMGVTDYSDLPSDLPPICGYESKWDPDSPYWINLKFVPAQLPEEMQRRITDWSVQLMVRLECHDYVRLDWRCNAQGEPKLLEVNPNPGWCWDGHLNGMCGFAGLSYSEMLKVILQAAEARYQMVPVATPVSA